MYCYHRFLARGFLVILMMEAECTFETSVNFYQFSRWNNPEDGHLYTRCWENVKYQLITT
jgi:hypothetical protein